MNLRNTVIVLLAAFLFGCNSPRVVMYDSTKRPPTPSVEVFSDGNLPTRPYQPIGEVFCEDFAGEGGHAIDHLTAKAREIGANGIIMLATQDASYEFNPFGRVGAKYLWRARAIVFDQPKTTP